MGLAIATACTSGICRGGPIWFFAVGKRSSLSTVASGTATRLVLWSDFPNRAWTSGCRSSNATGRGMSASNACCEKTVGES